MIPNDINISSQAEPFKLKNIGATRSIEKQFIKKWLE